MIDWSRITNEIRASGYVLSKVAKDVGSDWQHINRLARGEVEQPKYDVGVKLLKIHEETRCNTKNS
jgi:hypothetical protein